MELCFADFVVLATARSLINQSAEQLSADASAPLKRASVKKYYKFVYGTIHLDSAESLQKQNKKQKHNWIFVSPDYDFICGDS